jgi:hypothetical protein
MTEQTMTPGEVMADKPTFIVSVSNNDGTGRHASFSLHVTEEGLALQNGTYRLYNPAAVAALISERDGYKAGWWDVVEMLGGKKLDISNAQYHASVLAPKIRELIARNAELEAERDALFNAAKRHAEAIQQSIRFKDGSEFLKTQAAFEYSEASKALWKLIDAARAEGCGNG